MRDGLRFQKGDILAIGLVLVLAVLVFCLFLPENEKGTRVEIYRDGVLVESMPLWEEREITLEGDYTSVITLRDGRVAITSSDCPGEDCVASGWISRAGRSIVCLPNGVEVRVVGDSDVDFVVG